MADNNRDIRENEVSDDIDGIREEDIMNDEVGAENTRRIETIVGIIILVVLIAVAGWLIVRKNISKAPETEEASVSLEVEEIQESTEDTETDEKSGEDDIVLDLSNEQGTTADSSDGVDQLEELPQVYTAGKPIEYTADNQLVELYAYWDEYSLDAVNQLIRLDRMLAISKELAGSNDFYYYGDTNSKGQPEGKGLAVYADNTYYFGQWKSGKREGSGMWLRIFPDENGTVNGVDHVIAHSYNGIWANDYPNGDGQEHFDYVDGADFHADMIILNVMGNFKDGMYDGDELIMLLYGGDEIDYYGTLDEGTFQYIGDIKQPAPDNRRAIMQTDEIPEDNFFYLSPEKNKAFGIAGLK